MQSEEKEQKQVSEKTKEEILADQKMECADLLKTLIDQYWKPELGEEKLPYVGAFTVVNRKRMFTKASPCSGVNFNEQWPGVYLGLVKTSNNITSILQELFDQPGLNIVKNPHLAKHQHVFSAFQVLSNTGLECLLQNLKKRPELKSLFEPKEVQAVEEEIVVPVRNPHDVSLITAKGVDIYHAVENIGPLFGHSIEEDASIGTVFPEGQASGSAGQMQ